MVEREIRLVVALCNPKLMREFMSLANILGLNYSVPSPKESINSGNGLIIADDECIKSYGLSRLGVLIINESNISNVILGLGSKSTNTLIVGVDPGKRYAYVALSGGVICSKGYASGFKDVLKIAEGLLRKLRSERIIIKIGEQGREDALKLIRSFDHGAYELYLVSEDRTNCRNSFLKDESIKLNKDFIAALNIALRNGVRVI